MNYELAKKLKEAGFPQSEDKYCRCSFLTSEQKDGVPVIYDCKTERVSKPTLSELIEACGKQHLSTTTYFRLGVDNRYLNIWEAGFSFNDFWGRRETGSTPEEAVANLWLALNKK